LGLSPSARLLGREGDRHLFRRDRLHCAFGNDWRCLGSALGKGVSPLGQLPHPDPKVVRRVRTTVFRICGSCAHELIWYGLALTRKQCPAKSQHRFRATPAQRRR
jgi:hypothetical protein